MTEGTKKVKSRSEFKTMLVFPPQWTPQHPHFAITQLAGHMRSAGCKVMVKDLNVEFYNHVLSPKFLIYTKNRIMTAYSMLTLQARLKTIVDDKSFDFYLDAMKILEMERFFSENKDLIDRLPAVILDAKETLRDPRRFFNPSLLMEAFYVIEKSLEFISLPFHPARIAFNSFDEPTLMNVTDNLIQHAKDRRRNMFYDFFTEKVPEILAEEPDLIGISICSFSQVLPGLTLAMQLKKEAPEGTIINIGGNFFKRVKDALLRRPEFFENFCHCLSIGEGEGQSVIMVDELRSGRGFENVPNLLYLKTGNDNEEAKVRYTFYREPPPLDEVGFQDITGLPLDQYFNPELVLCLQSSKGCYWGKCSFCDTDYGVKKDIKSLDVLIEEIKYLRDKFGVKNFEFIDESISPEYMEAMARRFIDENLGIRWFSNGRIEDGFTPERLKLLHESGLTLVLWGLETGSRRIHRLINKGVDFDRRLQILRDAHDAGIWNFAYIFFGFPTETEEEAMETINLIVNNMDIIDSYGRSVFTLGKHSPLYWEAEKYGIIDMIEDEEELSTNLSYKSSTGLNDKEVDEMMRRCTKICARAFDYTLWFFLRYRENVHLYLTRYGRDYVKNYKVHQELNDLQVW